MSRRVETLMWVGLFAAPVAWVGSHALGWAISEANCEPAGRQWGIAFHTWEVGLLVVAVLLASAGLVASLITYREIRGVDKDAPPPPGRLWILSISGIVQSSLLLVIILLTHIGALALSHCHGG